MSSSPILFRQLFEAGSWTYTYIVACTATRKAAIIDPVFETVERDSKLIKQLDLDLQYGINTHVHADHVTGTGALSKLFPAMKSCLSDKSGAKADVFLKHDEVIKLGNIDIICRHTPGHTNGCASFIIEKGEMVFTGDALFVRGCGRTDFQQGDPGKLYDSVWNNILSLPDYYNIFPGHDYRGHSMTTVGEEKKFNPRLILDKEKFIHLMNNLNLDKPKQIERAVPANMRNGEQG